MDFKGLERVIRGYADKSGELEGRPGLWRFTFGGVPIMLVADAGHDRMRLISPVKAAEEVTEAEMKAVLLANFHTALDARYAVGNAVLFSAFLHPLGSLTEADLKSAIRQVAHLTKTFGTSYSSGELVFPGSSGREAPERPAPKSPGKVEL